MERPLTIKRRRWLMPVAVLLIASAIAIWGSAREASRTAHVHDALASLCRDVASGRDVGGRINSADPFVERQVLQALQAAFPSPELVAELRIAVKPGDVAEAGSFQGKATHTALLLRGEGGAALLGLRVQHEGGAQGVRIIGYWTPPSPSS